MVAAVVFDYGGVITSGGAKNEPPDRFAKLTGIDKAKAQQLIWGNWPLLLMGKTDEAGFWAAVEADFKTVVPEEQRQIWNSAEEMSPRPAMITFVKELKASGLRVGMLSNVIPRTEKAIREMGVYDLFDPCILSCRIGFAKPDVEAYGLLLKELPSTKPEEIVFVDDQERCLAPAKTLGFQTVLAVDSEQIIADVKSLLRL